MLLWPCNVKHNGQRYRLYGIYRMYKSSSILPSEFTGSLLKRKSCHWVETFDQGHFFYMKCTLQGALWSVENKQLAWAMLNCLLLSYIICEVSYYQFQGGTVQRKCATCQTMYFCHFYSLPCLLLCASVFSQNYSQKILFKCYFI